VPVRWDKNLAFTGFLIFPRFMKISPLWPVLRLGDGFRGKGRATFPPATSSP